MASSASIHFRASRKIQDRQAVWDTLSVGFIALGEEFAYQPTLRQYLPLSVEISTLVRIFEFILSVNILLAPELGEVLHVLEYF
jgi:hypothetical protein